MEQVTIANEVKYFYPIVRFEEIKPAVKGVVKETVYYDQYASVFSDWKVDTPDTYRAIIEADSKFWKLNRFIKDERDFDRC